VSRSADSAPDVPERRPAGPHAAGGSRFLQTQRNSFASNDPGGERLFGERGVAADEECQFEIFRKDEERMTSTLFSGGDWRWRLVTTGGLVLAEASGYPSETACRAAVAVLQRRAATAPVIAAPGDQQ
jgi:uncharacterized protein YegP (UPF0339 family)